MNDGRNGLVGTWQMLDWYNLAPDGEKIYPLGPDATGYISYSSDGHVFVHMMAATRHLYALDDPFGGTLEEDSAAIKSQISYAGPYTYRGDEVVHHVTHSSCPNWVGTEQRRNVRLDGDCLELSAHGALFQGRTVTAFVTWKRVATRRET